MARVRPHRARMGLLLSTLATLGACAHAPPPMHPPGPEGSFYVVGRRGKGIPPGKYKVSAKAPSAAGIQ